MINVLESFLCRYPEFPVCLELVQKPPETVVLRHKGVGVTHNLNCGVHQMLHEDKQWLWMLDDSCVFKTDILTNLLERDVDIVIPFSLSDDFPNLPVLYNNDCTLIDNYWLLEQEGLVETDKLATYRGMLVRRSVLEAMDAPWFVNASLMPDRLGGDIRFCQKAIECGFKIHIDFENVMGRIAHFSMWPNKNGDTWGASVHKPIPW